MVSVSGTEWLSTEPAASGTSAGEERATHQVGQDQVLSDQPAAQEPPRKGMCSLAGFLSFKLREAVLLCSEGSLKWPS